MKLSTSAREAALFWKPPRTAEKLRANPLGVYVNAINWSKEMG